MWLDVEATLFYNGPIAQHQLGASNDGLGSCELKLAFEAWWLCRVRSCWCANLLCRMLSRWVCCLPCFGLVFRMVACFLGNCVVVFHQLLSMLLWKVNEGKPICPKWRLPFKVSMREMIIWSAAWEVPRHFLVAYLGFGANGTQCHVIWVILEWFHPLHSKF